MKDFMQIWTRVSGRPYSAVNTNGDREMRDLSNRLGLGDIDTSTFEANLAECEGLNAKFGEDVEFNDRKDAIINRLFEGRREGQRGRHPKNLFILLMLGFFGLGAGFFILFVHPYDILFKLKVTLSEGGEIYEMWRKPEVNLYTRVFLFNVTNAEDFMSGKDKSIRLEEVGPYVYREALEHTNVTFNDNGTLSAIPVHPLTWIEELSEGHQEDDVLFMPNIALLSIAQVVASSGNILTRFGLNTLVSSTSSQPLVQMTAKEFMFGYKSSLLSLGNSFLPGWIKFDKLGLIDRMYDFEGDFETIFTGEDDVSLSGQIDTYRGSTDLPQWKEKHCSNVQHASDGTKFKGHVTKNDTVLFYRKSLCRAAPLVVTDEGNVNGLHAYLYTIPDNMLDNGKYVKENKCFCREGNCLPVGLIDVTDCYYGFPIALSFPHFYKADESLFNKVEGMNPSQEKHETRFWLQPDSGLPLDVSAKFQINMVLGDISSIKNSEKFSNMVLPLLWFDIRMFSLPTNMNDRFKLYLNVLPVVEQAAMYILFVIGSIFVIISVYRVAFKVMFKTFDKTTKKHCNIIIGTDLWVDREKANKRNGSHNCKSEIYAPCEVPLGDGNRSSDETDDSQEEIINVSVERRPSWFLKSHGDRIKELGVRLSDRVYDSVESVRDRVKDEITHVKNIFQSDERKNSLIPQEDKSNKNTGYRSDSGEEDSESKGVYNKGSQYHMVNSSDSEEDCKYLEVIDDGGQFDDITARNIPRRMSDMDIRIQRMNNLDSEASLKEKDTILEI